MLGEAAYQKLQQGRKGEVSVLEAERFFRIDDYVVGVARRDRLRRVVSAFRDDPGLRIAIITGSGEKFFSPGWDLKAAAVPR